MHTMSTCHAISQTEYLYRDVYVGAFYGNVYMRVGVAHGARMLADLSDFGLLGGKFHADESPCKIRHC